MSAQLVPFLVRLYTTLSIVSLHVTFVVSPIVKLNSGVEVLISPPLGGACEPLELVELGVCDTLLMSGGVRSTVMLRVTVLVFPAPSRASTVNVYAPSESPVVANVPFQAEPLVESPAER